MPRLDIYRSGVFESSHDVVESGTLLGRDPTADLVLNDPHVSRHHALIVREADGLWARDLAGKTPMVINGLALTEKRLQNGDRIGLGTLTILFRDDETEIPVSEQDVKSSLPQAADPRETEALARDEVTRLQYQSMQLMRPHLVVRPAPEDEEDEAEENKAPGDFFAINCALVSVGSDTGCVLKLDGLPGRALLIYRSQLAHRIRVLDEELGITVTGWKVRDAALRDGDTIYAGPYALEYREGVEG